MIARNWKWIAGALVIAAIVHAASLLLLPRIVMIRAMATLTRSTTSNTMIHQPRATWRSRSVVRPSPDLLYSICVYDLDAANGALRVSTHDMPNTYWSVSLFDANTNNFYALNDRQAQTGSADFLLIARGATVPDARLPVVAAPTSRGIILFRTLVGDERSIADIDAKRHHADCVSYKAD